MLGVCLGHQAIGQGFGGRVVRAPYVMHGKMSAIHHTGTGIFAGLPAGFEATRYHSLVVEHDSLPDCLEITAVQFHPESIASEHGHALLQNFITIANGGPA